MGERTELYDYELPQRLIAQKPLADRASSRLLVLHRGTGEIEHKNFKDILSYVLPGDLWVFNDTKVFPARIHLKKTTGANIELLLLEELENAGGTVQWTALARPGKRLKISDTLYHPETGAEFFRVAGKRADGTVEIEILIKSEIYDFLEKHGEVPLPPYIKTPLCESQRYQTVYAREKGSSAAPTAGLHFTEELLGRLADTAKTANVTLHIGMGTFKPIKTEFIKDHEMHREYVVVPEDAAGAICETRKAGGRVVAVGTTSVRSLEAWASAAEECETRAASRFTERTGIFIHGDYKFKAVDAMLTNFHLPRSTLLLLVSAFAGREKIMAAYSEAIRLEYRFFSFGDAMLII